MRARRSVAEPPTLADGMAAAGFLEAARLAARVTRGCDARGRARWGLGLGTRVGDGTIGIGTGDGGRLAAEGRRIPTGVRGATMIGFLDVVVVIVEGKRNAWVSGVRVRAPEDPPDTMASLAKASGDEWLGPGDVARRKGPRIDPAAAALDGRLAALVAAFGPGARVSLVRAMPCGQAATASARGIPAGSVAFVEAAVRHAADLAGPAFDWERIADGSNRLASGWDRTKVVHAQKAPGGRVSAVVAACAREAGRRATLAWLGSEGTPEELRLTAREVLGE